MGQLAGQHVPQTEAPADYYLAALSYIDPALSADSSMDDVIGAAARRQRWLRQHPTTTTAEELSQLTEALLFVQRLRRTRALPQP